MEPDFSKLFHQSSKTKDLQTDYLRNAGDSKEWPEEWLTTFYKIYPRLPKIHLSDDPPSADFFELIKKRESRRDFNRTPLTRHELSLILKYSCGVTGKLPETDRFRRAHPSAGARFPIEIYPIIFRGNDDLAPGLYHYNIKNHALDVLWKRDFLDEDISRLFFDPWTKEGAGAIVMTAVFWRNQNKYRERGYRYVLLEAGHIGQNIYLVAGALGLTCCALGGTHDEQIEKLIDIDGVTESVIYALAIGK